MAAFSELFSMVMPPGEASTALGRKRMPSEEGGLTFTEATSKAGV